MVAVEGMWQELQQMPVPKLVPVPVPVPVPVLVPVLVLVRVRVEGLLQVPMAHDKEQSLMRMVFRQAVINGKPRSSLREKVAILGSLTPCGRQPSPMTGLQQEHKRSVLL